MKKTYINPATAEHVILKEEILEGSKIGIDNTATDALEGDIREESSNLFGNDAW